jgi:hypothetical protein
MCSGEAQNSLSQSAQGHQTQLTVNIMISLML